MTWNSRRATLLLAFGITIDFLTEDDFMVSVSVDSSRENAHPGNASAVAYRTASGNDALRSMRWGLIPSFTKKGEKPNFFRMFNARSETAAEKPSFRRLVGRRNGVVAFSGFYEWKRDEKDEKQPYYLHYRDDRPMLMAALYDVWEQDGEGHATDGAGRDRKEAEAEMASGRSEELEREEEEEDKGGALMFSYTILTTSASPRLRWLHDRMPVMLTTDEAKNWINCRGTEASAMLSNHKPYSEDDLLWHPVTKRMSSMGYEEPDCCTHIELKPEKPVAAITSFFNRGTSASGAIVSPPTAGANKGIKIEGEPLLATVTKSEGGNDANVGVDGKAMPSGDKGRERDNGKPTLGALEEGSSSSSPPGKRPRAPAREGGLSPRGPDMKRQAPSKGKSQSPVATRKKQSRLTSYFQTS